MDEAEYCDRISIMVAGRIAAMGAPMQLKRDSQVASIDELFVQLARPDGPTRPTRPSSPSGEGSR
jgi:ABC-2 type transport system ATP-binding protein